MSNLPIITLDIEIHKLRTFRKDWLRTKNCAKTKGC